MVNEDILVIANLASLKISANNKLVDIKHKFRFGDQLIWGVMLFLIAGVFFVLVPVIKLSDMTSKILSIVIGLSFLLISILSLVRQAADRLKITSRAITFRFRLKQNSLRLDSSMKIKMETEIIEIKRVDTIGSAFISLTHYLQTIEKEIPILNFQMNNSNADKAVRLGNEITRLINDKFRQFN